MVSFALLDTVCFIFDRSQQELKNISVNLKFFNFKINIKDTLKQGIKNFLGKTYFKLLITILFYIISTKLENSKLSFK